MSEKNSKDKLRDHQREIYRTINMNFFYELHKSLWSADEKYIIPDKKIIHVLILSQQILNISRFIEGSVWRENWLDQFIERLKLVRSGKIV